jgi:hypothetical protein
MGVCHPILPLIRALVLGRIGLAAESFALRQQLAIHQRTAKRPKLRLRDRVFWVWLAWLWSDWRSVLVIVQPATVVGRHRQGFRLYWRWKSQAGKTVRPRLDRQVQTLIRRMSRENVTWGAPRIQSDLRLPGYDVAESTVARYMGRGNEPSSPTWRTFLSNHVGQIAAIDCFVVLAHERRRVLHFNVTAHPGAEWATQQIIEAFPFESAPRFLLRDRDSIYGEIFQRRVKQLGIAEVLTTPQSPWQNPYVERFIGSVHRECLVHVIVLYEGHLNCLLAAYFDHFHQVHTHWR